MLFPLYFDLPALVNVLFSRNLMPNAADMGDVHLCVLFCA